MTLKFRESHIGSTKIQSFDNSHDFQKKTQDSLIQRIKSCAYNISILWGKNYLKGISYTAFIIAPISLCKDLILNKQNSKTAFDEFQEFPSEILDNIPIFKSRFAPFLSGVILMPIVEELIFRGVVQKKIANYFNSKKLTNETEKDKTNISIKVRIISSLIFGYSHLYLANYDLFDASLTSLTSFFMESKSYEKDGLLGSIGIHMGNNSFAWVTDLIKMFNRK
jgi:membrane protease YdiL (CAAX protease family)